MSDRQNHMTARWCATEIKYWNRDWLSTVMDYQITAPVVLLYSGGHPEEEPIRADVVAESEEDAIEKFQREVHQMLVESGTCEAVDFYPVDDNRDEAESPYDITIL